MSAMSLGAMNIDRSCSTSMDAVLALNAKTFSLLTSGWFLGRPSM
jgi:hypothetical protein